MFENLTNRLARTVKNLRGQGRLTEANIQETLREIRVALLEADVALPVVRQLMDEIKSQAIGQEVMLSLTPGQALIKIVYDQLTALMGAYCEELNLNATPPAVILLAGLQGSGKTTTAAKLAHWLKTIKKKSVLLTSTDIYRPAAIEQLEILARDIDVNFYPSRADQQPVDIAQTALQHAKRQFAEVVIVDTAGRLHIDAELMTEIQQLHECLQPIETLFVVDGMTGQDAANTARAFHDALPLTGVILTKVDGDARGGAALSIRAITGKSIKFMGVGEKITALEPFHPDRVASRILGMGDVLTLVEEASRQLDQEENKKMIKKLAKGQGFDLEDFRTQLQQMGKMGGIAGLLDKLPGIGGMPAGIKDQVNDKHLKQIEAMINSMTPQERRFPDIIRGSRKRRIALGSGTQVQDINRLLKQFTQMQKMMKRFHKSQGMMKMFQGFFNEGTS